MIIVSLSFLIDNLIGNMISINSLFYPLFTLLSLIIIYPYYKRDNRYYIIGFITGLAYDIAYTNTLLLNALIFTLIVYLIILFFNKFGFDYLSTFILTFLLIIVYRFLTYLILVLIGYLTFDLSLLFKSIYQSILINILFISIGYKLILMFKKRY